MHPDAQPGPLTAFFRAALDALVESAQIQTRPPAPRWPAPDGRHRSIARRPRTPNSSAAMQISCHPQFTTDQWLLVARIFLAHAASLRHTSIFARRKSEGFLHSFTRRVRHPRLYPLRFVPRWYTHSVRHDQTFSSIKFSWPPASQSDTVAGSPCLFSPNATGWSAIQAALNSGTTTAPSVSFDPLCYGSNRQIVYKASIGANTNGSGAPAFVFERQRSPSDHAVIQIP